MECRPGSPDSISDFGRLLFLKSNHLAQVSRAFSSCQHFDFHVIDFNFFCCVRALVAENFRLSWMDSESVGSSFSARVPRSSAESHRVFVHHILEDEVVGQKEEQGAQRDGDQEEEVNGEVESIRETHNEMTHGTCA